MRISIPLSWYDINFKGGIIILKKEISLHCCTWKSEQYTLYSKKCSVFETSYHWDNGAYVFGDSSVDW